MIAPFHPELAFAPSREIAKATLRDTAQFETLVSVRQPNGTYTESWVAADPVPALMIPAGTRAAQIAAGLGTQAQWEVKLIHGTTAYAGQRAMIRGTRNGTEFQRWVEVTGDVGPTGLIERRVMAVDVEFAPSEGG